MFENEQISTRPEVDNMLRRLEARVDAGKYNESTAKKAVSQVVTGIVKAKEILKDKFDFNTKSKEEIAALTNAWVAWNSVGVFEGEMDDQLRAALQGLLSETEGDIPAGMKRFARQIWRTEMVGYIIEKVQASTRSDKGDVVEAAMTVQKVTDKEDDPIEALGIAQNLDDAIKSKSVRKSLAARMEATGKDKTGGMKYIATELLPDSAPKNLKVVVGGELLTIPPDVSGVLTFKNIIKEGNRVYAQMLNGCRGNLAIIELGPPGPDIPPWPGPGPTPSPGPTPTPNPEPTPEPGPGPGPTPPGPEPTPPPPEPGPPTKKPPPIDNVPPAERGKHEYTTVRPSAFVSPGEQYHERISDDVYSHRLVRDYNEFGSTVFLQGISQIPEAQQGKVLEKVFVYLGETDPNKAFSLMSEILNSSTHVLFDALCNGFREAIDSARDPDIKKVLEIQLLLLESGDSVDPFYYRTVFRKLKSVNEANLPPELREMHKSNGRNLTFIMRRSTGVDIMEGALSTMDATFSDREDLEGLRGKSDAEIKKNLGRGLLDVDRDEEVYLSSWHVMTAVNLAIKYQYAADFRTGHFVKNPVQYYFNRVKDGSIKEIEIPPEEVAKLTSNEPLGRSGFISGNKIDLTKLFIDRENEFRLFERYQSGELKMGQENWTNLYRGTAGAFLSPKLGGIIKASDKIFGGDFFSETGKDIGQTEAVYLFKVATLLHNGSYDEARAMCIQFLGKHLNGVKQITPLDVQKKVAEYSEKELVRTGAQIKLHFKSRGLDENTDFTRIEKPDGGFYSSYQDFVDVHAIAALEEKAMIELSEGVGEGLFERNPKLNGATKFEQMLFGMFTELNGYGYLNVRQEKTDMTHSIAKTVAEIGVTTVGLAFGGALMGGAVGLAPEAVSAGGAGLRAGRTAHAGRTALSARRAIGSSGAFNRAGYALGSRITGGGRLLGIARLQAPVRAIATGSNWGARLGGRLLYAGGFVEGQHLLNASLHPFEGKNGVRRGLLEIGSVAITIYGLDKLQKTMRGIGTRLAGGPAGAPAVSAAAPGRLARTGAKVRGLPGIRHVNQFAGYLGNRVQQVGGSALWSTKLGRAGVSGIEFGTEVAAFHFLLEPLQTELGILARVMTRTEAEAMIEPDTWKQLAHTAAVVVGLRTRRAVAGSATAPRETLRLSGGRPAHEVDAVQAEISTLRTGHELPQGVVKIGGKEATQKFLDNALNARVGDKSIRDHYKDAKNIADTGARDARLLELDNILAQHMIIMSGGSVRFGTREAAEAARDSLQKQYPDGVELYVSRNRTPADGGGARESYDLSVRYKGKLADHAAKEAKTATPDADTTVGAPAAPKAAPRPEVSLKFKAKPSGSGEYFDPAYSKDTLITRLRTAIKTNRGDTMPSGRLKIGKKEIDIDKLIDSTGMRREYMDAWGMNDKAAQSERLTELDQRLAEHIFLENSTFTPGLSERQARRAIASSLKENPEARYAFEKSADGKYTVHRLNV